MQAYSKAIAAVVAAIASVLIVFNVDMSTELQGSIITIVTTLAVILAPRNEDPV